MFMKIVNQLNFPKQKNILKLLTLSILKAAAQKLSSSGTRIPSKYYNLSIVIVSMHPSNQTNTVILFLSLFGFMQYNHAEIFYYFFATSRAVE